MLALDYLRRSRKLTPEIEMKAVEYVNVGYQRLLTFEVRGGGFDWYGNPPANVVLSAYGLLEFSDMAKVYDIDERVIQRTRAFLLSKQQSDGSWKMPERTAWSWTGLSGDFIVTSYVAWSLAEAGDKGPALEKAREWIRDHMAEAKDNYALALAANALGDEALLAKLDAARTEDREKKVTYWKQENTAFYGRGDFANIETTALAAYALMKSNRYSNAVNGALGYLAKMKDARGTWGSTSATILSLRAILRAMSGTEQKERVVVKMSLNGQSREIRIDPDQADVLQLADLTAGARTGANAFAVETAGEANSMYQLVARYWLPWDKMEPAKEKPLDVKVAYDRTTMSKDDILTANVTMAYRGDRPTFMIVLDLGIPPGFTVDARPFEAMVTEKRIDKFSTTAKQITLYFGTVEPGQVVTFAYGLRAKYPLKAKTPKSEAYEYYAPDRRAVAEPVELEVTD
ncbi:MAG: hypothetical protein HYY17_02960 [Planctomycetes bacterium]|nr:hypothetical protein [Planctomycetota bacterium]